MMRLLHRAKCCKVSVTPGVRVKRELRASFHVIDCLLNGLQPSEKTPLFCDLIGAVDVVVAGGAEAGALAAHLDTFTENVDSTYGCVLWISR